MLPNTDDVHESSKFSEIKRSELYVEKLLTAFEQYLNPFEISGAGEYVLYCLSSGKSASQKVTDGLLNYVKAGKTGCKNFIQIRLIYKTIKFQNTVEKLRLQTFQSMAARRDLTTTQNKKKHPGEGRAEYAWTPFASVTSQFHQLEETLSVYPFGPIPWSISTADGTMA